MDQDMMASLLQPGVLAKFLREQQEKTASATNPNVNVPVRIVEPPVQLRGKVELLLTFPYDAVAGKTYEELVQKVYRVLGGESDMWELPQLNYGGVEIWKEEIRESETTRGSGYETPITWGVPEAGDPDDGSYAGDSESGTGDTATAGDAGTAGFPHDGDYLTRLISAANRGHAEGGGGEQPGDSEEPGAGGPGWKSVEPSSEEKVGKGS